jgi:hypothetical protein
MVERKPQSTRRAGRLGVKPGETKPLLRFHPSAFNLGMSRTKPAADRGDERRTEKCECERSRLLRLLYACGFTASAAGRERTTSAFL